MAIFYKKDITPDSNSLPEEESRHCALILRSKIGDEIQIFDGKGSIYTSNLTLVSKRICEFEITKVKKAPTKDFSIHLGIAPTKNVDRMEWMIEKLSEIGVDQVTFLQTQHSERKKLRLDRLEKKAISAMKQSGNPFLIKINELTPLDQFLNQRNEEIKLIAHVADDYKYLSEVSKPNKSICILIGPEGDFSLSELDLTKSSGFKPVTLGKNTLRTETAGFVACCMINTANQF